MVWSTKFNFGGVYTGVCLLKVVIQESHLDINATTHIIKTKLPNLDIYSHIVGNKIYQIHHICSTYNWHFGLLRWKIKMSSGIYLKVMRHVHISSFWIITKEKRNAITKDKILPPPNWLNFTTQNTNKLSPEQDKLISLDSKVEKLKENLIKSKKLKGRLKYENEGHPKKNIISPKIKVSGIIRQPRYWNESPQWCWGHKKRKLRISVLLLSQYQYLQRKNFLLSNQKGG